MGKGVVLTAAPGKDNKDKYDRLLRYVDLPDGTDSGLTLIQQGHAIARYDSRDGYGAHPREESYIAADAVANADYTCSTPTPERAPEPVPKAAPVPAPDAGASVYYANCAAARAARSRPAADRRARLPGRARPGSGRRGLRDLAHGSTCPDRAGRGCGLDWAGAVSGAGAVGSGRQVW